MTSNPFYDAVNYKFPELDSTEQDISHIASEIESRMPTTETVKAAYISVGSTPASPNTILDVFLLTDAFIYNYELKNLHNEQWFTLPLTSISYIVENLSPQDDRFWSVLIGIRSRAGEHGLVLQDNMTHKDKMREFADACRDKLSALIVRGELNARELEVQEGIGVN